MNEASKSGKGIYILIVAVLCVAITFNIIYGINGGILKNAQAAENGIFRPMDLIDRDIYYDVNGYDEEAEDGFKITIKEYDDENNIKDDIKDQNTENDNKKVSVLIYHTHTNEAYMKDEDEKVMQMYAGRTNNENYSVLKVGDTFQKKLSQLGFDAVQDRTNNEANGYNSAYSTSREAINNNIKKHGEFDLYIDLHRDAYVQNVDSTIEIDGKSVARVMIVLGKKAPDYEANLVIAQKLMDEMNSLYPGMCEKVLSANATYNQNISDHSILIEIGDNAVTIDEACRSAEYVAQAMHNVFN